MLKEVFKKHLIKRAEGFKARKEVNMIAINPVKINTNPVVFGNRDNNYNHHINKNHYDRRMPNIAALAIQGEGARTSFERDWNVTKEADAVQSNMFLSPFYKIQKAIKIIQNRRNEAVNNMPHVSYMA